MDICQEAKTTYFYILVKTVNVSKYKTMNSLLKNVKTINVSKISINKLTSQEACDPLESFAQETKQDG